MFADIFEQEAPSMGELIPQYAILFAMRHIIDHPGTDLLLSKLTKPQRGNGRANLSALQPVMMSHQPVSTGVATEGSPTLPSKVRSISAFAIAGFAVVTIWSKKDQH
jgi:hypothetical protein